MSENTSEVYDAIVVGAGIGGSTCAALLARRGLRTLLVDKNSAPGGKAMSVGSGGYRYDLWPIVGGPSLGSRFEQVLDELGLAEEVEFLTPDDVMAIMYKGADGEYRTMVGSSRSAAAENLGAVQLLGLTDNDLPELLRLFGDISQATPETLDALDGVSFADFLGRYDLPRSVLSYLGIQSNIIFVVPIDRLAASEAVRVLQDFGVGGAGRYHAGGFGRVAEVFCDAVERNGRVLLDTRVEEICVESGGVTGVVTDRGRFEAPIVVSNAGIQPTVLSLVGEQHFEPDYVHYVRDLVPSWAIVGKRYFLDRPFFEQGMYIAFTDDNYMDSERFDALRSGWLPDEVSVFNVVPAVYDPDLAPDGKQVALVGTFCTPDPDPPYLDALLRRLDETVERIWPGFGKCVESSTSYGTTQVSRASRDSVLAHQGGECIGLAQIVGQCGSEKPSARSPLRGLYYVGCDAGGYGCGTHQAADSGVNVAGLISGQRAVEQAHT